MDAASSPLILVLFIIALIIMLNSFIAGSFYDAARAKGFDGRRYFWLPFFFGMVGYLLVIALPNKR